MYSGFIVFIYLFFILLIFGYLWRYWGGGLCFVVDQAHQVVFLFSHFRVK